MKYNYVLPYTKGMKVHYFEFLIDKLRMEKRLKGISKKSPDFSRFSKTFCKKMYSQVFQDLCQRCKYWRNTLRRQPSLPVQLRNMFHSTDELLRTNNSVEGSHKAFQVHISSCHPNFWKFIFKMLQKEETLIRFVIVQNTVAHSLQPRQRRYLDCNCRILAIADDYVNMKTLQYLRAIAHNFFLPRT